jgi:hypothetical protein
MTINPEAAAELEAMLSDLLMASSKSLGESQRATADEYLYHREYQLALEIVASSYAANGEIATNDVLDMIERLAGKMKLDPTPILSWAKNERKAFQ